MVMWVFGFWYALLTAQIIAIHHLFIFSFRKGGCFHYCIIISFRGYARPEQTSVSPSLLPHAVHCGLLLHNIMLLLTWLRLSPPHNVSCSLWALLRFLLFIALQCQYHKKPHHWGWQWARSWCYKHGHCWFSELRLFWVFAPFQLLK